MKKMISLLTSFVFSLCIMSNFFTASIAHSADEARILTAGNIGLSDLCPTKIELRDDCIYIGMYDEELYVTTCDEFSCSWKNEDGYYFTPVPDGKYQIFFPYGGTLAHIQAISYLIECHDNTVDIRLNSLMTFDREADSRSMSITTSDSKTATYEIKTLSDIVPVVYYDMHLFFDEDYWFEYSIERGDGAFCQSLYMPLYNNDDIVKITDSTFIDTACIKYAQGELLSENAPVPQKIYSVESSIWYPMTGVTIPESVYVDIIRTNGYDKSYISYTIQNGMIQPTTLKITKGTDFDLNLDREFNVADVVMLQKQLLGNRIYELTNWRAADICQDGVVDVFDLVLMKKALLASQN
ncbi:MAG: dockerin type I repeat-containing protein [Ruminococcus sp.]|uniref:dockerin type I repeat-containing protein n=1 Tax=Ruminococcus sp. TaxID=41978 RepID=UPI0025D44626|nr:dockerin type I repeat-containing protein [Ruminococcus sp.]MCR5600107.1 dockerin type I repeat-containing protein [Ruminococcus sp.]